MKASSEMTLERKLEEHLFLDVKIYPATFARFPIIKTGVTSTERERLGEHL